MELHGGGPGLVHGLDHHGHALDHPCNLNLGLAPAPVCLYLFTYILALLLGGTLGWDKMTVSDCGKEFRFLIHVFYVPIEV